jgi:multidrug efflux pump subunit AcrB
MSPANASMAMLFSFFVAVIITPWLLYRVARQRLAHEPGTDGGAHSIGAMGRFYLRVARPLLTARRRAWIFLVLVAGATAAACVLFVT